MNAQKVHRGDQPNAGNFIGVSASDFDPFSTCEGTELMCIAVTCHHRMTAAFDDPLTGKGVNEDGYVKHTRASSRRHGVANMEHSWQPSGRNRWQPVANGQGSKRLNEPFEQPSSPQRFACSVEPIHVPLMVPPHIDGFGAQRQGWLPQIWHGSLTAMRSIMASAAARPTAIRSRPGWANTTAVIVVTPTNPSCPSKVRAR
jgi:hypothetical protein